jgi:DNA-binding response OmpR family regulator
MEAGTRLPIVLLTARVQEDDIARGFEAGADCYVQKPFGKELVERVDELLGRR